MTLPYESKYAVKNTKLFLLDLLNPKITPKVPLCIRKTAGRLLRHYPDDYYVDELFGSENDEKKDIPVNAISRFFRRLCKR